MADCAQILEMLSGFLDRDLPPDTCRQVQAHLDSCAACGAAAADLRQTVALCRQYRSEHLPGPLPESAQQDLKAAFEKVLRDMQSGG